MNVSISTGEEFEHSEQGKVSVKSINQKLSNVELSEEGKIESKKVNKQIVEFYSYMYGITGSEELQEFISNVD
jgi:hypothetical protein